MCSQNQHCVLLSCVVLLLAVLQWPFAPKLIYMTWQCSSWIVVKQHLALEIDVFVALVITVPQVVAFETMWSELWLVEPGCVSSWCGCFMGPYRIFSICLGERECEIDIILFWRDSLSFLTYVKVSRQCVELYISLSGWSQCGMHWDCADIVVSLYPLLVVYICEWRPGCMFLKLDVKFAILLPT